MTSREARKNSALLTYLPRVSEAALAQSTQKLSILREAHPSVAAAVLDVGDGSDDGDDLPRNFASSLGIGKMTAGVVQIFALTTPRGTAHCYGQPFDGRLPLPGEHHVVLPFPSPAPAIYMDGFTGGSWTSPDPAFQAALRKHPISSLVLGTSWDWRVGGGTVKRVWLAQLRPTADGRTHFAMEATGERSMALDARTVGFATFTKAVTALVEQPPGPTPGAMSGFL